ncbi:zonular occludens toxin domain-containing protein [Ramlibacter sp. 2FC]|uniref:zonular occludens toxin domain-containing protein n=1 Tax=Ramlibacter sp. 2FC TaxID=2502188 RepID=UPI0010F9C797|nr:zonular occludens toxin domain-containing protein [Ramlibacter sp. 2FC]
MITFVTGPPGSGKTLYTISKLLQPLVGTTVKQETDDGLTVELPRTIYTNVKGLLIDHELIDEACLNTWHEWAKPGSIICFDEVQKPWPPRPNGSKVPDYIQHLETHRHMGIDFIVMTQHPLLVDRNLVNLVGRHLHMRRVANFAMAVVYEWDHASKSLLYKNSITKSPWRYDKKVYKLYKSAEVHTKQPRKVPGLVWFILVGLIGVAVMLPTTYARIKERALGPTPTPATLAQRSPAANSAQAQLVPASMQPASAAAGQVPSPTQGVQPARAFAGCSIFRGQCSCFDDDGRRAKVEPEICAAETDFGDVKKHDYQVAALVDARGYPVPPAAPSEAELDAMAWMSRSSPAPMKKPP